MTTKLAQYLRNLELLDLITLQKNDTDPTYAFKHIFTQESVYNSLLLSDRRQLHQQVGEALEYIYTTPPNKGDYQDTGEMSLLLAHHFEQGNDTRRAIQYMKQAAQNASKNYANREAWSLYNRILNLLKETDLTEQWDILAEREQLVSRMGLREAQAEDLAAMMQLAQMTNDTIRLAITYKQQSIYYDKISQYDKAAQTAEKALAMAEQANSPRLKAQCLNQLALAAWRRFDYKQVKTYANQALETLYIVGDPLARLDSLLHLGKASYRLGQYDAALDYMEAVRELTRFIDNPDQEATCHLILGWIYQRLGDYGLAEQQFQATLEKRHLTGDKYGEAMALSHLGWVACDQADYQKGLAYCEEALKTSQSMNDRENEAYSLTGLALNYEQLEQYPNANQFYYQAWQQHEAIGATTLAIFDQAGLARMAIIRQDKQAARQYIQPVVDWVVAGKALQFWDPWSIYLSAYQVLTALHETTTAQTILAEAHRLLRKRAKQISDDNLRYFFQTKVKVNQQIEEAWQETQL